MNDIGIVAVGGNEGQRLVECVDSVAWDTRHIFYLDSRSADESVAHTRLVEVEFVELDRMPNSCGSRAGQEIERTAGVPGRLAVC